jgi:hypothetical protein
MKYIHIPTFLTEVGQFVIMKINNKKSLCIAKYVLAYIQQKEDVLYPFPKDQLNFKMCSYSYKINTSSNIP